MEQKYIKERLESQIDWYDKKSQTNQKCFKRLKFIEILCAALIPFLVAYSDKCIYLQYLVGILGIVIAIITGVLVLYKFQENWIEYRTTCETLIHQKYLYETECVPYDNEENRFNNFVQTCESIISKENSNWTLNNKTKENDTNKPNTK